MTGLPNRSGSAPHGRSEHLRDRDAGPAAWPTLEESRAILADYVAQFGPTGLEDGPLPEDPDPGNES